MASYPTYLKKNRPTIYFDSGNKIQNKKTGVGHSNLDFVLFSVIPDVIISDLIISDSDTRLQFTDF